MLRKTGDWAGVVRKIAALNKIAKETKAQCLSQWALKAEALAKGHISAQDLPWKALSPSTVEYKTNNGYSLNILVMTSSYFQNITSWVEGDYAIAGVKRGVTGALGDDIATVARTMEYGSVVRNIPARPLWQPVLDETMAWTVNNNNPTKIFLAKLQQA